MERSITEELLSAPMIRLAEILDGDYEYSKTELAAGARIGYPTLFRLWPTTERFELLIPTRSFGRIQLFRMNSI